jgi:predicted transcriptional regulator
LTNEIQPTSIRLPVDLKQELERAAVAERRTTSWLIVEICRMWLKWREQNRDAKLGSETEIKRAKK